MAIYNYEVHERPLAVWFASHDTHQFLDSGKGRFDRFTAFVHIVNVTNGTAGTAETAFVEFAFVAGGRRP